MAFNQTEQEIIKYGLQNGKSKVEVEKALSNYRLGIKPTGQTIQKTEGYSLNELGQDISQAGQEIYKSTEEAQKKVGKSKGAFMRGEQGALETAGQTLGTSAGLISNTIGSIFKGVIKATLPQTAETAIKGGVEKVINPVAETEIVKRIIQKYNSLDDRTKRNVDALIGGSSLALDIATMGAGKKSGEVAVKEALKIGEEGLNIAQKTTTGLTKEAIKGIEETGKYTTSRVPKLLGIFTGENNDVISYALKDAKAADLGLEQGDSSLRNVIKEGATNSIKIKNAFIKGYADAKNKVLGQYTKTLIPRNNVKGIFNNLLKENNVQVLKDGTLDFTKSKIIANPGEVTKIQRAYEALNQWDKFTLDSLDDYKQLVGQLTKFATEAGVPSKSPFLGKFYNELNNIAKNKLPKDVAEKYIKLNKKFSDNIELYNDMVDAFNSGDPFTKLANALGKNKDTLREVINFYEKNTGKSVLPIVAGRELAMEKQAAFGFLNPRSWIDFFLSPKLQGKIILKLGEKIPK